MAGYYANYGPNAYDAGTDDDETKRQDTSSTPVDNQLYDYTQGSQDNSNPYSDSNESYDDVSDDTPTQEQAAEPEQTAPQNEAERTEAAAEQNSNTHEALREVTSDEMNNIYQTTGVNFDEWAKLTSGKYDIGKLLSDTKPETQKYRDAINMYMGYASQAAAQPATAPASTQAPAQQTPAQNPILPSAGGNYKADSIYDPSKTYGRQADGSYVYSNSAAQLQRDLNRVMKTNLTVDGYFGAETQKALDAYLAQYGKKAEPDKGADTLTQAAHEAPKAATPSNAQAAVQNTTNGSAASTNTNNPAVPTPNASSSKPAHDDAWYAEQYEKITGNAPRTDILSPERIRDFVDQELAKRPVTPEDEGYDAMLQQRALYEQAQEQQRLNEMNERRDEAFTPKFINDLRNGKSVEQILGEGDKSYNRWIEDNWDDLSYTYNLSESPFGNQTSGQEREPINYAAMLDELNQMDRNDWYQRPESQTGREPINYNAMADELAQLERNDWYQRPQSQTANEPERTPINYDAMAEEFFQRDRNDWYQRPETPQAPERTPLEYSDAFTRQQDMNDAYSPRQTFNDNYQAELERIQNGGMASDDIQSSSSNTASSDEQAMRDAYEAAMQSAGRARDIFLGLPTEAEQMQQAREQWQQNMRTALEDQFNNPYMQQFKKDFEDVQRQFPNYSYSALADMVLFNEEMRNGQSSYYKWLTSQL